MSYIALFEFILSVLKGCIRVYSIVVCLNLSGLMHYELISHSCQRLMKIRWLFFKKKKMPQGPMFLLFCDGAIFSSYHHCCWHSGRHSTEYCPGSLMLHLEVPWIHALGLNLPTERLKCSSVSCPGSECRIGEHVAGFSSRDKVEFMVVWKKWPHYFAALSCKR